MQSKVLTPQDYADSLPDERRTSIDHLRKVILDHLPEGFSEEMNYGMIGYVVPHSLYPPGYHCNPKLPLPFMNLASQKNYIALYHMGLYADNGLRNWFTAAYLMQTKKKPDMGKSCIRFKKTDQIPYDLIGELAAKISPKDWIDRYEKLSKR